MARETTIDRILKESRYDPTKQPNPDQVVFTIQNQPIGSRQNFITVTGMPKGGKSRFISAIISSALTNREIWTMRLRPTAEHYQIIHLDTEQGDYEYYKSIELIKNMSGVNQLPRSFHSFNMREHEPKVLIQAVDRLITGLKNICVVILDGILDLLYSYNDEAEAKQLINLLKKWSKTSNCLIIAILHVGKTTGSTVGHFGAMSDRASQSILEVKRNDIDKMTTFSLIPKTSRSADPSVMTPIEIYWDIQQLTWQETGSIGYLVPKEKGRPADLHNDMHVATLRRIFDARGLELKYTELITEMTQLYDQPRKWCKTCISYLVNNELLYKNGSGKFTITQQSKLKV
jgi:hypothetical protein